MGSINLVELQMKPKRGRRQNCSFNAISLQHHLPCARYLACIREQTHTQSLGLRSLCSSEIQGKETDHTVKTICNN